MKKLDTKGPVFYDSMYMKYPEIGKFIETEYRFVVAQEKGKRANG